MELPKEKIKASTTSPNLFVLYSAPKMGKTTLISKLDNCLLIDLENGSDYVDALKVKVNSLAELKELGESILKAGKPYKYIAIDTVTRLEDWCEDFGKQLYMNTPMGRAFTGGSVLELPNGGGYLYLREAYKKIINYILTLADKVILIGHLKDKMIEKKGKEVSAKDIDLTGKIKSMTCANADAVGYLYRDGDSIMINFVSQDEVLCGSRCDHLKGKSIEIGVGNETHWELIYND